MGQSLFKSRRPRLPALKLQYLAIAPPVSGRGGAVRFFLLANGLAFEEETVAMEEWRSAKQKFVELGIAPSGHLPIIFLDARPYPEHVSMMRLLARLARIDPSSNPLALYAQDVVGDAYADWRAQWSEAQFGNDKEIRARYIETVPRRLLEFEALVKTYATSEPFLNGTRPLWGDSVLFSLISDNLVTGMLSDEQLKAHPRLYSLYSAFMAVPAVQAWFSSSSDSSGVGIV